MGDLRYLLTRFLARIGLITGIGLAFYQGAGGGTQFPPSTLSDPAFDDFERASLGSNWTIYNGDVDIISNSDLGVLSKTGPIAGTGIVAWSANTFSPNQFAEAVLSPDIHPDVFIQVFVRRRASDLQRYGFMWGPPSVPACAPWPGGWILKLDGGLGAPTLACVSAPKPNPGDTIRIEAVGSSLKGFLNGIEVISTTDVVLTEPGEPGITINVNLGMIPLGDYPVIVVESWTGGGLVPPNPPKRLRSTVD